MLFFVSGYQVAIYSDTEYIFDENKIRWRFVG